RGQLIEQRRHRRAELVRADTVGTDRVRRERAHAARRRLDHAAMALGLLLRLGLLVLRAGGEDDQQQQRALHCMTIYATSDSTATPSIPTSNHGSLLVPVRARYAAPTGAEVCGAISRGTGVARLAGGGSRTGLGV